MIDRRGLLNALQRMPDEAFKWVALAIVRTVYVDGLGDFTPMARVAIEWAQDEARKWLQRHRDDAKNRG